MGRLKSASPGHNDKPKIRSKPRAKNNEGNATLIRNKWGFIQISRQEGADRNLRQGAKINNKLIRGKMRIISESVDSLRSPNPSPGLNSIEVSSDLARFKNQVQKRNHY